MTEAQNQVEEQVATEAVPPCDTEAKVAEGNAQEPNQFAGGSIVTEASSTGDGAAVSTAETPEGGEAA